MAPSAPPPALAALAAPGDPPSPRKAPPAPSPPLGPANPHAGKAAGPRFAVHGVDASDVLNVRSGPSPKHDLVGTIPADARGIAAVGPRRQIGPSVWREVSYQGMGGWVRGWVNDRFLVEERGSQRAR
ncbi:MAG TPA: hypothetical protein VIU64_02440 [Polyangia bacterium]